MSTSKPVDYYHLYSLNDPIASRPLRLDPEDEWMHPELASRISDGKEQPSRPVVLRAAMGGQATDFLWTRYTPYYPCISQRVVELFGQHGFTGWATYPVAVHGRKGELLPGYWGLAITGPTVERQVNRSAITTRVAVPGGKPFQVYRGLYFNESQWDGSDFFWINGFPTVTQKVRDALKRAKIRNVELLPLDEVELDVRL